MATRNRKKLEELARLLSGMNVELLGLDGFPDCPDVEETGETFEENSALKARAAAECSGSLAVADDSGLEVDALNGAPGVYSARYSGPQATDEKNVDTLLKELRDVPAEKRTARFRAVITLAGPDGSMKSFEGVCEGSIGFEPKGAGGFGYDPVFYPQGHDRTFAEMAPAEKDALSHRAKALKALKQYLEAPC